MSINNNGNDFSPITGGYSRPTKLKYWCQKVLPLVYDDSLSYYELLCKVVSYLNNVIDDLNKVEDDVIKTNQDFITLVEQVNNEIESINNELQTFENLTQNNFNEVDEKITEIDENVNEIEDRIIEISNTILLILHDIQYYYEATTLTSNDMIQGYWEDKVWHSSSNRICINRLYRVGQGDRVEYKANTLMLAIWVYYDDENVATSILSYTANTSGEFTFPKSGEVFVQERKTNNSALTPADYDAVVTFKKLVIGVDNLDSTLREFYDKTKPPFYLEDNHAIPINENCQRVYISNTNIGSTLSLTSSTDYYTSYIDVNEGEIYLTRAKITSTKISHYVVATDNNLTVKANWISNENRENKITDYIPCVIPEGATRLYICSNYSADFNFLLYFKPIKCKYINSIQNGLNDASTYAFNKLNITFTRGQFDENTGEIISSNTRAISNEIIRAGKGSKLIINNDESAFSLILCNPYTGGYIGQSYLGNGIYEFENDCLFKIYCYKLNSQNYTDDEIANLSNSFYLTYLPMNVNNTTMYRNVEIPNYYYDDNYFSTIIETIRGHESVCGSSGDEFIFFTDFHIDNNYKISPVLMHYIIRNTSVRNVVFNGDAITSYGTIDEAKQKLQNFRDMFWFVKNEYWFPILGNHEFNDPGASHSELRLNYSEAYCNVIKPIERNINVLDEYLYYIDNKAQKIRYFFFGCTFDGTIPIATVSSFLNALEDTPDGYYVGVFSHIGFGSNSSTLETRITQICDGLSAFNTQSTYEFNNVVYDYSNTNGIVMFVLVGHRHKDWSMKIDDSFYCISTTSDVSVSSEYSRTRGTITEQAFDVVQIDKDNRSIYLTRVGAGNNRTFTF